MDPTQEERIALYRAKYRVIVLKTPGGDRDQRVHAICLEANLVGRGADWPEALRDLTNTLLESFEYQWTSLLPMPQPNPDPELLALFEGTTESTEDGAIVLGRHSVSMEFGLGLKRRQVPGKQGLSRPFFPAPRVTYEDSYVMAHA